MRSEVRYAPIGKVRIILCLQSTLARHNYKTAANGANRIISFHSDFWTPQSTLVGLQDGHHTSQSQQGAEQSTNDIQR